MNTKRMTRDENHRRSSSFRTARPCLEGLEDRLLLFATSGDSWVYSSRITYSFMPDGTSIGGLPSNMYSALNSLGYTAAQYQTQVEKAAAVWQAVANINLALVPDSGAALGVTGNQQDDSRFGDIRIGGYAQGNMGPLAFTFLPPPADGGTVAGDILFNSNVYWQVNGSTYDIETVAIHEIGHALGMSHSDITTADMYAYYNNTKQSLTSDDIAGIQSIYGARPTGVPSNNTAANAIDLSSSLNASGQLTLNNLAINTPNMDIRWYSVTAPASTSGTLTVSMQSSNLSSLCPQLVVYNSTHNKILANVTAPGSYGATDTATLTGATAGTVFYIRLQAAQVDAGGTGAFGLQVNFSSTPLAPIAPPNTVVAEQPDAGGGASSEKPEPGSTVTAAPILGNSSKTGKGKANDDPQTIVTIGSLTGPADALVATTKFQRLVQQEIRHREVLLHAHQGASHGVKSHASVLGHWRARVAHKG